MTAEWYYIGHYGQLGPLTREQIDELVEGGVIERSTWIWKAGMTDWVAADSVAELAPSFTKANPYQTPPPSPMSPMSPAATRPQPLAPEPPASPFNPLSTQGYLPTASRSSRSRILGGVLQFLVPGVGRMYLGYTAIGIIQFLTMFCGVGIIWSWIDGIVICAGGVRLDGFGHRLND